MMRISDSVKEILLEDSVVIEAMQRGLINLSAYAKQIHKAVEEKTMKPVALGTIVVTLSRLTNIIHTQPAFHPKVEIASLSVTPGLGVVTYEKTEQNKVKLAGFNSPIIKGKDFFAVTESLYEITIICSEYVKSTFIKYFQQDPMITINGLVAVSVRFSLDYIEAPNTIYSLMSALATRHINIIEVASTYKEFSFIVRQIDMDKTVRALDAYSRK
ncbi:MAG: hypothetical protein Q8R11_00835 [bacterium]|nr:hypothetical protein [bacterium]